MSERYSQALRNMDIHLVQRHGGAIANVHTVLQNLLHGSFSIITRMCMSTSPLLRIASFSGAWRSIRVSGGSGKTARPEVEVLASSQLEGHKAVCEKDNHQPYA
jgi:hypothetical protein